METVPCNQFSSRMPRENIAHSSAARGESGRREKGGEEEEEEEEEEENRGQLNASRSLDRSGASHSIDD